MRPTQTMLITGAGSGIGQGLAEQAARDGWQVLVTDLHAQTAATVARAIVAAGGRAETADTDITINTICPSYVRTPLVEKQIANRHAPP